MGKKDGPTGAVGQQYNDDQKVTDDYAGSGAHGLGSGMNSNFESSPADPTQRKVPSAMGSKPFTLKKGSIFKKADPNQNQ